MGGYANPDALVDTTWLASHLDDPTVRVVEVDEDTTAYEKGHIQGAVGWNWFTDLHKPVGRDYVDQAARCSSMSVHQRSTAGRSWPPTISRRSRPRFPATSRARPTCPGPRPPTRTARSSPRTSFGRCTRARASPQTRRSSPTAASE